LFAKSINSSINLLASKDCFMIVFTGSLSLSKTNLTSFLLNEIDLDGEPLKAKMRHYISNGCSEMSRIL